MRKGDVKIPSRVNKKGGKRGCLCPDGLTYSSKCCDGSLHAQGIGSINAPLANGDSFELSYRIKNCADGHEHNAHLANKVLKVDSVYYIVLSDGHEGCYTVLRKIGSKGLTIESAVLYDDCAECISAN